MHCGNFTHCKWISPFLSPSPPTPIGVLSLPSAIPEERVQLYFRCFLAMPVSHSTAPPTPGGLALIQPELAALAASFISLVNFNKQVYTPFYMGILKSLLFSNAPQSPPGEAPAAPVNSQ